MQLNLERPDFAYALRGADGSTALLNERVMQRSFIVAPDRLVEEWPVVDVLALAPADLDAVLGLEPELVLLGAGSRQAFPPAAVLAACLTRGIGIEVMTNAAAARTFNVLASEGRRVVAAFILDGG